VTDSLSISILPSQARFHATADSRRKNSTATVYKYFADGKRKRVFSAINLQVARTWAGEHNLKYFKEGNLLGPEVIW
jgi:hypothetical protein